MNDEIRYRYDEVYFLRVLLRGVFGGRYCGGIKF